MQMTTMASSSVLAANPATQQHHMDRLDAARALLGVSPQAPASSENTLKNNQSSSAAATRTYTPSSSAATSGSILSPNKQAHTLKQTHTLLSNKNVSFDQPALAAAAAALAPQPAAVVPIPSLNGLDALAALASKEQASLKEYETPLQQRLNNGATAGTAAAAQPVVSTSATSSDNDDDSEAMPPPPPRAGGGRRRSVSNPEGMEKWAPYNRSSRRHFVLPASILEEELAEASAAMEAHERNGNHHDIISKSNNGSLPLKKRGNSWGHEEEDYSEGSGSETPDHHFSSNGNNNCTKAPISGLMSADEQANLTPEELLKRARSRLLEDLSEGNINGEKGVVTLPHSLAKYKEVYNKNGRIGIYTPAERAAIIARFQSKRSRRVWNKKIRYNCRKNLADRRMRVKGRFVKRSTEEEAKAKMDEDGPEKTSNGGGAAAEGEKEHDENESEHADVDMPDVNDPDAGFCPTEDQPYRRTRRHTIT